MTNKYWAAPIKNPPPKPEISWEETMFKTGYERGLVNGYISDEARSIPQSPIMQGYRAGMRELRLKELLLKSSK